MQIESYEYSDIEEGSWKFSKVEFSKISLLVGDSGTGKTRFLNTIFSLGSSAVAKEFTKTGKWDITVQQGGIRYRWIVEAISSKGKTVRIAKETLSIIEKDGKEQVIISRDEDKFNFQGSALPKLSQKVSSISLLQEEKIIRPVFNGFGSILRRNFWENELKISSEYQAMTPAMVNRFSKDPSLVNLFHAIDINMNIKLYLLHEFYRSIYDKIIEHYKAIFPFVTDIRMINLSSLPQYEAVPGEIPVLAFKEKSLDRWIDFGEMSSGMLKVLIILTDSFILPDGGIYLVDEYENSLGMGAIDFFPAFLLSFENNNQFIMTSHHPYIINKIPVENWFIFHRKGSNVSIQYGEKLKERYGKSKQQSFIQLINDPMFSDGVE